MKINLEDCCYESAVRRMYIKDSCLVDIFNMYLPDVEDPDNAREFGCMVLTSTMYRWNRLYCQAMMHCLKSTN